MSFLLESAVIGVVVGGFAYSLYTSKRKSSNTSIEWHYHKDNENWLEKHSFPTYQPSLILKNGVAMVILGAISKSPLLKNNDWRFDSEIIEVEEDGGKVEIDWYVNESLHKNLKENSPIIIGFHGIIGNSRTNYLQEMCRVSASKNWRMVGVNARGMGTSKLESPRGFHAGKTEDVRAVIKHVKNKYPEAPLIAIGYSLGANYLCKYIGESGENSLLLCGICVSNPFDLTVTSKQLQKTWILRNLDSYFATALKNWLFRHSHIFDSHDILDKNKVASSKTVREFDEYYILPNFSEFKSVDDYYVKCSSINFLDTIKIPVLFLHSNDNPVCPIDALPKPDYFESHPNLILCKTRYGGHVCWLTSWKFWSRDSWIDKAAVNYIDKILKQNITVSE